MRSIRSILLVALCLISYSVQAGETWITVPIASWHTERQRENGKGAYEQTNLGLGLEYVLSERWRLGAGIYRNSIRSDTGYVGALFAPVKWGPVRLGASVGVVSGYASNLMPVVVPTAMIEGKSVGANLLFIPAYDGQPGGVGLQIKWKLP